MGNQLKGNLRWDRAACWGKHVAEEAVHIMADKAQKKTKEGTGTCIHYLGHGCDLPDPPIKPHTLLSTSCFDNPQSKHSTNENWALRIPSHPEADNHTPVPESVEEISYSTHPKFMGYPLILQKGVLAYPVYLCIKVLILTFKKNGFLPLCNENTMEEWRETWARPQFGQEVGELSWV